MAGARDHAAPGREAGMTGWRAPLSREEEAALALRLRQGDAAAAERLVTTQLPFVMALARRYSRYGPPVGDLVQEGVLGLLQAMRRFNPELNVRLSTYAGLWVRAAIQDHVVRSWSMVRIGTTVTQKSLFFRLRRIAGEMGAGLDEAIEERLRRLAARFGTSADELRALARRIGGRDRSLNETLPGARHREWLDLLPDPAPSPEQRSVEASESRFWRRRLAQALASLPPREQLIIRRRYLAEMKASFEAIARELNLSKERVRQLEAQALRELRRLVPIAGELPGAAAQE